MRSLPYIVWGVWDLRIVRVAHGRADGCFTIERNVGRDALGTQRWERIPWAGNALDEVLIGLVSAYEAHQETHRGS